MHTTIIFQGKVGYNRRMKQQALLAHLQEHGCVPVHIGELPLKAHFIGICGAGMSPVAKLLKESGWTISGSDEGCYPPVSDYLTRNGLPCLVGYSPENIPVDADLIVVGKHARLEPESNGEVCAAMASSKRVVSFPEVLSDLTRSTNNLVIAGSFGKSTNSALIAWCLLNTGRDPSYFIGATPIGMETNAHIGCDGVFVLEGDEYPSANWDDTSKFLYYNASSVLLISGEHDHVNVFPTVEDYLAPFIELVRRLPADGVIVACQDGENVDAILSRAGRVAIRYGLAPGADWTASGIGYGPEISFTLERFSKPVTRLTTSLLGAHNVQNIVGASAFLLSQDLLTVEELKRGIASFQGVRRRLDSIADRSAVPVYEGFGSSHAKARAAIEAMRLRFPDRRLIVVFEPHTFSLRSRAAIHWYDDLFDGVGYTLIYDPPTHGAETIDQLSQDEIVERVRQAGHAVEAIHGLSDGLEKLERTLQPDDAVLISTSGGMGGLVKAIPKLAERLFPKLR